MSSIPRSRPPRPPGPRAGYHCWQKLSFLHWEVPVAWLQERVHPRLTIDTFEGRAFIGLVPFTMKDIQLRGLPKVPSMTNFHETNVRTYVHLDGKDPGVWFFSLDAASKLCVLGARATYHLPYHFADMRIEERDREIRYESTRNWPKPAAPPSRVVVARGTSAPACAKPGTLEEFLAERYLLYSQKNDKLYRGQVFHPPYPLMSAECTKVEPGLLAALGLEDLGAPISTLYSPGVEVDVFAIERA